MILGQFLTCGITLSLARTCSAKAFVIIIRNAICRHKNRMIMIAKQKGDTSHHKVLWLTQQKVAFHAVKGNLLLCYFYNIDLQHVTDYFPNL